MFAALGLTAADFVRFDEPMLLRRIVIPGPAFEALNFSHAVFARFLNGLGERICPPAGRRKNDTPAYLTKLALKSGNSRYVNEDAFANRLVKAGSISFRRKIFRWPSRSAFSRPHDGYRADRRGVAHFRVRAGAEYAGAEL